jgi:hypothetical protein
MIIVLLAVAAFAYAAWVDSPINAPEPAKTGVPTGPPVGPSK